MFFMAVRGVERGVEHRGKSHLLHGVDQMSVTLGSRAWLMFLILQGVTVEIPRRLLLCQRWMW